MTSGQTDCHEDDGRLLAALVLLHSTDTNSTEELRLMLEDAIERKLARSSHLQLHRYTIITKDAPEKEDIPRISIPDEGSSDGIFCKVCNGTKLGPMVLLECQDCQEAYHPLCHNPPVIDIDVYDPRLVWRCGKCITNDTATQPINQYTQGDVNNAAKDFPEGNKRIIIDGELVTENSGVVLSKHAVDSGKFSKLRATNNPGKRAQTFQSRRRIGLKRSINRRNAKHTCT